MFHSNFYKLKKLIIFYKLVLICQLRIISNLIIKEDTYNKFVKSVVTCKTNLVTFVRILGHQCCAEAHWARA